MVYNYNYSCDYQNCSLGCCDYWGDCATSSSNCYYTYHSCPGTRCTGTYSSDCCFNGTTCGAYICSSIPTNNNTGNTSNTGNTGNTGSTTNNDANVGLIVGSVVGGVVGLVLIIVPIVFIRRCLRASKPIVPQRTDNSLAFLPSISHLNPGGNHFIATSPQPYPYPYPQPYITHGTYPIPQGQGQGQPNTNL